MGKIEFAENIKMCKILVREERKQIMEVVKNDSRWRWSMFTRRNWIAVIHIEEDLQIEISGIHQMYVKTKN